MSEDLIEKARSVCKSHLSLLEGVIENSSNLDELLSLGKELSDYSQSKIIPHLLDRKCPVTTVPQEVYQEATTFGELVSMVRTFCNLTRSEMESMVGVSAQTIYRWEKGYKNIKSKNESRFYQIFGIEPDFIGKLHLKNIC